MKTKCMSCGGPTKKMQNGGTKGAPKKIQKQGPIKTIKTMRNALKKINTDFKTKTGCFGAGCSKMQNGGSCFDKVQRKNKRLQNGSKVGRVLKNIGKGVLGTGLALGAGALAYKKSTPFKNFIDNTKDKLGFNQKGGAVKKYQNGGVTDSLKIIRREGKLAVKTEKQKQAAAKKAAANAKKIAKAKENARLNLEWQKMTKDQKDDLFIKERQKNW